MGGEQVLELAESLLDSLAHGRRLAVATVIAVDGSAPRALGTSMAVDDRGHVIGSISGGCVEGAVYDACNRVLEGGEPEVCEFGFTDDDAFAVGLSCGGRLTVVVQELGLAGARNALSGSTRAELVRATEQQAAGLALVVGATGTPGAAQQEPPVPQRQREPQFGILEVIAAHTGDQRDVHPREVDEASRARIIAELHAAIHSGRSVRSRVDCEGRSFDVVFLVSAPPPRLIVFGAVDFSVALSNAAALLGYRVTVCDARPVFATARRFPNAEVVNRWPADYLQETDVDARTAVCILTHDDKFDVPLIEAALALPVAFVGAMGSRVTHERRVAKLRERGIDESALASLHSPIGLDIGAASPEETAVSILAEILAARTGATGSPLRSTVGPIHRAASAEAGAPIDFRSPEPVSSPKDGR
jgi:xanthine dehydrogenase accessory factor